MPPEGFAFPSDEAFRAELVSRNVYRFKHRDALLERLENQGRKERMPLSPHTVDHIMPQGERLPDAWKAELGPDWAQTWQSLRHTLGNLTLTAFNPEMGNRPFRDKRDAEKGYRDSPLRLNADLRQADDPCSLRTRVRIPDKMDGIEGWRVAVSLDLGYKTIDPEVERNTRAAAEVFRDLGCVVEDVALGWHSGVLDAFLTHSEALYVGLFGHLLPRWRYEIDPFLVDVIERGMHLDAARAYRVNGGAGAQCTGSSRRSLTSTAC